MDQRLELDPYEVLGLRPGADATAVRQAYRKKAFDYHPDQGGDEWAFRVVCWAYEQLGSGSTPPARVRLFRIAEVEGMLKEEEKESATVPVGAAEPAGSAVKDWTSEAERVRLGVQDKDVAPERIVQVEVVWMRYETGDVFDLLKRRRGTSESNLGGTLHLLWPEPEHAEIARSMPDTPKVLAELRGLYEWLRTQPEVLGARVQEERGKIEAWLEYSGGSAAWKAFNLLRPALKEVGLGVRQWTRDLRIPKEQNPSY